MAPYQPGRGACAAAPVAAETAARAAPARSLNFILRALSLPSVLRPIDPVRLISRPAVCVSVTKATLRPQSSPARRTLARTRSEQSLDNQPRREELILEATGPDASGSHPPNAGFLPPLANNLAQTP